jgi:uncharacterized protein
MKIGIISDTHGVLTPEALTALAGVERIIHAGDIGSADVIKALEKIAPVAAVRGNMDGGWANRLPWRDLLNLDDMTFYVVHDLNHIDLDPHAARIDVVVSGHTHRAQAQRVGQTLYFNPGSASVSRHGGPLTTGIIRIQGNHLDHEILHLHHTP